MKKQYQAPQMKVVEVSQTEIICASPTGTFSISDGGSIGKGDDSDWSDTNLDW